MQATNIVLADAQATPVDHTFIPIGRDKNGVFWFEDQSMSNSVGFWRVSVETKRAPIESGVAKGSYRTRIGFHQPVLEVLGVSSSGVTPPPTVAYAARTFFEFIDPVRSAQIDRDNQLIVSRGLLWNSLITRVVTHHEEITF